MVKCEYCKKPIKVNKGQLSNAERGISFNGKDYHGRCMDDMQELQGEWQAPYQQEAMDRAKRGL